MWSLEVTPLFPILGELQPLRTQACELLFPFVGGHHPTLVPMTYRVSFAFEDTAWSRCTWIRIFRIFWSSVPSDENLMKTRANRARQMLDPVNPL